ncbi:MAG: hypothetical protein Q4F98_01495, partial [Lachnospiraceae bacterium]|nr:hypothetical protein [Lachnospiraceae bacterium]
YGGVRGRENLFNFPSYSIAKHTTKRSSGPFLVHGFHKIYIKQPHFYQGFSLQCQNIKPIQEDKYFD